MSWQRSEVLGEYSYVDRELLYEPSTFKDATPTTNGINALKTDICWREEVVEHLERGQHLDQPKMWKL